MAYSSAVTVYFADGTILKRRIEASDSTSFWLASAKMTLHGEKMRKSTIAAVKQTLFQLGHFPNNRVTMINQQDMKVHAQMDPRQRYKLFLEASLLQNIYDTNEQTINTINNTFGDIESLKQVLQRKK